MSYVKRWEDLQAVEAFPGNFRVVMAGLRVGINPIRWVHPTSVPKHHHEDAEQVIIPSEGQMRWIIDGQEVVLRPGDVAIISARVSHTGESMGEAASFYEVFAPPRIQYLAGFIGKLF